MQKAILFRSMLDSLNFTEFEQFLTNLYMIKNKRDIITKSLFYLMSDECRRNDHNYCNDINQIITKIIHNRKLKGITNTTNMNINNISTNINTNNVQKASNSDLLSILSTTSSEATSTISTISVTSTYPTISFRELPSPTISECASYLHFSELPPFLYCSRYIYISCKSIPTTIVSLDEKEWFRQYINNYGEAFRNYQLHRLTQYKMLQYISLHSINQIIQLQTIWRWQSLHTIHIHNPTWTYSQNQVCNMHINIL